MKLIVVVFLLINLSLMLTGCANFGQKAKAFLNGGKAPQKARRVRPMSANTFKKRPNYNAKLPNRNYKRVTKKTIENSNKVDSRSGSLWVMEGQGAYLFSQNIMRQIGDPLAVRIDGEPKQQLETKVKVIKDLLEKIKARRRRLRRPAGAKPGAPAQAGAQNVQPPQQAAPQPQAPPANTGVEDFNVKTVPTRIVERLVDGNYRVKGSQPFMIGKREYKTIVTGIVRAEDFAEEGIMASKLIDPKFDIISVRKRKR